MSEPMPVMEFEGSFIRTMEGKLPQITLDMPEGYKRGTHLAMEVEVRVRNVFFNENKDGDLVRQHVFALEEIKLTDAWDPDTRPNNVGGNSAGDAWEGALLDYLNGETDELDFEGESIPERLHEMLQALYGKQAGESIKLATPFETDLAQDTFEGVDRYVDCTNCEVGRMQVHSVTGERLCGNCGHHEVPVPEAEGVGF
jgi:hypothetical protein